MSDATPVTSQLAPRASALWPVCENQGAGIGLVTCDRLFAERHINHFGDIDDVRGGVSLTAGSSCQFRLASGVLEAFIRWYASHVGGHRKAIVGTFRATAG